MTQKCVENNTNMWHYVYMKKRDLEQILKDMGFELVGGSKHDKWCIGEHCTLVPRHREINEITAKQIIKQAQKIKKLKGE
jgi:mRNA interferase HicA